MNRLTTIACASAIALAFIGATAAAVEPEHALHNTPGQVMGGVEHGGNMHEMMMRHMQAMHDQAADTHKGYAEIVLKHTDELKLTDEQIGKITRIHQTNQQKVEEIGKNVRETMKTAHEVFLNPASDEATIRKAAQEHTSAFNNLVDTALASRNAINAVLTPEQLQKLKSLKGDQ